MTVRKLKKNKTAKEKIAKKATKKGASGPSDQLLKLKKLNACYIVALEWDRCPALEEFNKILEMFDYGVTDDQLKEALANNQGRRPDEIASEMSELIKKL